MKKTALIITMVSLFFASTSEARNFALEGMNELGGGFGFAAGITDWTPGGFKWFNEYSRRMSEITWLNFQFNVATGDTGYNCWYDSHGHYHCDNSHFGGTALELDVGAKLKWRARPIPLQIHAKFGGAMDFLFLWNDVKGVAIAFRGGAGVRYFFVPTFGVGAELMHTIGPAILNHDVGVELYATIDFNVGVEWRF